MVVALGKQHLAKGISFMLVILKCEMRCLIFDGQLAGLCLCPRPSSKSVRKSISVLRTLIVAKEPVGRLLMCSGDSAIIQDSLDLCL